MDKYDELLARLDKGIATFPQDAIYRDAAAAIRELEVKLEAERKAREEADEHAINLRNEIIRLDTVLAAAARAKTLAECAAIVRKHYPMVPA